MAFSAKIVFSFLRLSQKLIKEWSLKIAFKELPEDKPMIVSFSSKVKEVFEVISPWKGLRIHLFDPDIVGLSEKYSLNVIWSCLKCSVISLLIF